jgi:GGDEF domain-containing protein
MTMKEDRESASFLSRAYQIAKLIAVTLASVVAFVISLIALDLSKGHWWVDIRLPLYGVTIIITAVVAVCAALCIWLALVVKDALDSRSFYRNESKSLRSMVSMLQDLAYNDSITGIPNSNKLREDMKVMTFDKPRCLILLDLENFGVINKKYNHWVGDEYLRRFSQMVTDSGRRNEFLFKIRPLTDSRENPENEVKAFRKNSGGDEFFMLLEGTVMDGLGYLNRLIKRGGEFERMAMEIMKERHRFGFCAGVVSIAVNESYESVSKRVSHCLGLALEEGSRRKVYWIESEMPKNLTPIQRKILEETEQLFGCQRAK